MTDFAALRDASVQFMTDNQLAVDAHAGAAWTENHLLRVIAGIEDAGSATALSYSYAQSMKRGVPSVNNRSDAYVFTHTIFFATNFGKIAVTGVDANAYASAIDAHCAIFATDFDVLGEMLICAKCIGYWSPTCDNALSAFINAWQALDRLNFGESYHTILVGGILFSMLA